MPGSCWNPGTHKTHMNHILSSPAQEFVPEVGLEPTYRKALDPKSSASTNFATRAYYLLERDLLLYTEDKGKFQFLLTHNIRYSCNSST